MSSEKKIVNRGGQCGMYLGLAQYTKFDFFGLETWARGKETPGIISLTAHRIELSMYLF